MYELLIGAALVLMVIGPAVLGAVHRARSRDMHF